MDLGDSKLQVYSFGDQGSWAHGFRACSLGLLGLCDVGFLRLARQALGRRLEV